MGCFEHPLPKLSRCSSRSIEGFAASFNPAGHVFDAVPVSKFEDFANRHGAPVCKARGLADYFGEGHVGVCGGAVVGVVNVALQEEGEGGKVVVVADDVREVGLGFAANVGNGAGVAET